MTAPQDPYSQPPGTPGYPAPGSQQVPGQPYGGQPYGAGAPGGPAYGGGYGPPPAAPRSNGLAIAALVVGVLALLGSITVVGGILLGLIAIGLGIAGRRRARRGAGGSGLAVTGIVLGVLAVLLSGLLIAAGLSVLNSDAGQQLQDCLEQAGGDQAAVQQCQTEFAESQ